MKRILVGLERHGGDVLKPHLVALRNHMDIKSVDGPVPTVAAGGNHIGLAEPIVFTGPSAHIFHTTHSGRFTEVEKPLPTVTAAKRGEMGLLEANVVEAFMLSQQSGGIARSIEEPAMTVAAKGAIQLVEGLLLSAGGPIVDAFPTYRPVNTILTRDHMAVAEPVLVEYHTETSVNGNKAHQHRADAAHADDA